MDIVHDGRKLAEVANDENHVRFKNKQHFDYMWVF